MTIYRVHIDVEATYILNVSATGEDEARETAYQMVRGAMGLSAPAGTPEMQYPRPMVCGVSRCEVNVIGLTSP